MLNVVFFDKFVQLFLCHKEGYTSLAHTYKCIYPSTFNIYHKQQLVVGKQCSMNTFVTTPTTV